MEKEQLPEFLICPRILQRGVFECSSVNQRAGLFILDPSKADFQEGKLTKAGIRIRLQEQLLQILALFA